MVLVLGFSSIFWGFVFYSRGRRCGFYYVGLFLEVFVGVIRVRFDFMGYRGGF